MSKPEIVRKLMDSIMNDFGESPNEDEKRIISNLQDIENRCQEQDIIFDEYKKKIKKKYELKLQKKLNKKKKKRTVRSGWINFARAYSRANSLPYKETLKTCGPKWREFSEEEQKAWKEFPEKQTIEN